MDLIQHTQTHQKTKSRRLRFSAKPSPCAACILSSRVADFARLQLRDQKLKSGNKENEYSIPLLSRQTKSQENKVAGEQNNLVPRPLIDTIYLDLFQSLFPKAHLMICRIAAFVLATMFISNVSAAEDNRFFEMRTYYANEGKLDELQARFRDHTLKLFKKHGMTNIGYWVPKKNDDNTLIYILAYPNQEARESSWKAFLADPQWKAAYKASIANGKLVAKIKSIPMKATHYSPVMKPNQTNKARLFELRTYTTQPEKLGTLNSRFRDHTIKLFTKHGLTPLGFWVPTKEKDGASNQLIYMLSHESMEARKANFQAFGKDPEWQSAKAASQAAGPVLVPKGIQSQILTPTDFSPTR